MLAIRLLDASNLKTVRSLLARLMIYSRPVVLKPYERINMQIGFQVLPFVIDCQHESFHPDSRQLPNEWGLRLHFSIGQRPLRRGVTLQLEVSDWAK